MEKLYFSVIIPTFERPNDLKRCLLSLLKSNQLNSPSYEIIVSDDSDTDKCKIVTENCFEAAWGKGKKIGPAGNRNAGAARAKGEWIVFVDDDCIAQENYLEE